MERLGLGYADLAKRNPRLIYAAGYEFGEIGPMAKFPGQDMLAQSFSGFAMSGRDADEMPRLANPPTMDYATAVSLTQGIMAALIEREHSGLGQAVTTSLFEVAIGIQTLELASRTMHGIDTMLGTPSDDLQGHGRVGRGADAVRRQSPPAPVQGIRDRRPQPGARICDSRIADREQSADSGGFRATLRRAEFDRGADTAEPGRYSLLSINDLSVVIDHPQTKSNGVVWEGQRIAE
jgi:hypothetical protein